MMASLTARFSCSEARRSLKNSPFLAKNSSGLLLVADGAEIFFLLAVVLVDHALELGPNILVHLAGYGADALPHLQQLVEGGGGVVPLFGGGGLFLGEFGSFLHEGLFGQEIAFLLFLALVVVFLAALVDLVGGVAESLPDFLVLLDGHGAGLFPAGAEVLQAFEGFGHGALHDELFGGFAKFYLLLEVALLVESAQLAVDFQLIEELFYLEMIVLPEVVHLLAGHFADGFPALLDFVEFLQRDLHLFFF